MPLIVLRLVVFHIRELGLHELLQHLYYLNEALQLKMS